MLRRRDLLIRLSAMGMLSACGAQGGGAPVNTASSWPGDLPSTSATWQDLPAPPLDPRRMPTLTWTGTELLVTGGSGRVLDPTFTCPPNADCMAPPTAPVEDSGATHR